MTDHRGLGNQPRLIADELAPRRRRGEPRPLPAPYRSRATYTCGRCGRHTTHVIVAPQLVPRDAEAQGPGPGHVCQRCYYAAREEEGA